MITKVMLSLDQLQQAAKKLKWIPHYVFENAETGATFFCGAFLGRQDVIYFYEGGVKKVYLVDHDEERIRTMQGIYPSSWTYRVGDAFAVAKELRKAGTQFDVVCTDQWSLQSELVWIDHFMDFYSIARNFLILRFTKIPFLDEHKLEAKEDMLTIFLQERHKVSLCVKDVIYLCDLKSGGGVYNAIIEVKK